MSKDTKYIIIKSNLVHMHMIKISILLAIPIIIATSLIFASMNFDNVYGQQNQTQQSSQAQPIRPDQQAAQAQQQQAAAVAQQQQAAVSAPNQAQQTTTQENQTVTQQQQAAVSAPTQANQTTTQANQTLEKNNKNGNLNIDNILNYTNNAVVALHGKHPSIAKLKIASD
ncbi:MAG: hypothetical protein M3Z01_05660, partial [Thermoproteota archaeon]|nr:hypothetical protein [Thermoproteota archaeon]